MLALDQGDDIFACRNLGVGILQRIAYADAIDGEMTVSVLASGADSCKNKVESRGMSVEGFLHIHINHKLRVNS